MGKAVLTRMIPLTAKPEDDPTFVALVSRIIRNEVRVVSPSEIFVVQIDGWFGCKWLEFSGKELGALGVWGSILTVPPFHPNRVLSETKALIIDSATLQLFEQLTPPLHRHQTSGENLSRKITDISKSALFVWYSSGTRTVGKASLMVYTSASNEQSAWYASFDRKNDWMIYRLIGLSKQQLGLLMKEDDI